MDAPSFQVSNENSDDASTVASQECQVLINPTRFPSPVHLHQAQKVNNLKSVLGYFFGYNLIRGFPSYHLTVNKTASVGKNDSIASSSSPSMSLMFLLLLLRLQRLFQWIDIWKDRSRWRLGKNNNCFDKLQPRSIFRHRMHNEKDWERPKEPL